MTKQLLIYERAVPVTISRHKEYSVQGSKGFGFAKNVNSIPLIASEFGSAARDLTIVFAGDGDKIMPSVILGVRADENLFVDEDGNWTGRYIPAFLRRYPFVFSRDGDAGDFTLCLDEEYEGLNTDGVGERLFDAEGNRTQYLDAVVNFVTQFQTQFEATQRFCAKIQELDLLEPAQAVVRTSSGESHQLAGFMRVSREKLGALSDDALLSLARSGELELIHAHMHSLDNVRMVAQQIASTADGAEGEAAAADA